MSLQWFIDTVFLPIKRMSSTTLKFTSRITSSVWNFQSMIIYGSPGEESRTWIPSDPTGNPMLSQCLHARIFLLRSCSLLFSFVFIHRHCLSNFSFTPKCEILKMTWWDKDRLDRNIHPKIICQHEEAIVLSLVVIFTQMNSSGKNETWKVHTLLYFTCTSNFYLKYWSGIFSLCIKLSAYYT
jgi:hypothetical protein